MIDPAEVPQVNLNGSDDQVLFEHYKKNEVEQYMEMARSMDEAATLLAKYTPHGRDWQTKPADTYVAAIKRHHDRIKSLLDMRDEFIAIADEIATLEIQKQFRSAGSKS